MKFDIKARDIKFFILGLLTAFIFAVIYDWDNNKKAFKEGYEAGRHAYPGIEKEL
ncbi:MAG: hypothetical protein WBL21_02475 [Salinimicrobium sp.]